MRARPWNALLGLSLLVATTIEAKERQDSSYFEVDIKNIGAEDLARLKAQPGLSWWIEADDVLFVLAHQDFRIPHRSRRRVNVMPDVDRLFFVQKGHARDLSTFNGRVLAKAGRMALVQADDSPPAYGPMGEMRILPFQPDTTFAKQSASVPEQTTTRSDPAIQAMIAALNGERWHQDVARLASFNRYSYGEELAKARDWLMARFQENDGLTVELQEYQKNGLGSWNVIATIQGTERPDDIYIFGAHYDTTSESPRTLAPGAEDNASGTAGLLELARVFATFKPSASIAFVAFSGEEQGLWGSQAYVKRLLAEGKRDNIKAVVTMDMIAYDGNGVLDCLIETSGKDAALVAALRGAAATYTKLELKTSEHYWGSDHVSFINAGIPAVLTIEDDWNDYPDYHRTTDGIENIDVKMGMEVLKMNLAAVAGLAQ